MRKRTIAIILTCAGLVSAICFLAVYMGYRHRYYQQTKETKMVEEQTTESPLPEVMVVAIEEEKILPSTRLIYEYYYKWSEEIKTEEELAPNYLVDMTKSELANKFPNWDIRLFSSQMVIMRKNIEDAANQKYLLGIYDGYVAVFVFEGNTRFLKELTGMKVEALSAGEREMLIEGVVITGEQSLLSALQDYSS